MNGEKTKETRDRYIRVAEASRISCMHPHTLRKYAKEGKIKSFTTPAGQKRFDRQDLEKLINSSIPIKEIQKNDKINYLYARVSSKKQMDDLERQINYIKQRRPEYSTYTTLSDIASGINFKRKGLEAILDSCIQGTIGEVIIAHRDRLCRFGFELINIIVEKSGGKIIILDNDQQKSTEQELSEDLLSIVHIYSCKQMGKRSYKSRQQSSKIIENKIETTRCSKEDV